MRPSSITTPSSLPFSFAVALLLLSVHARGACPNQCELSVPAPTITPALSCATISVTPNDCNCAFSLHIDNGCTESLESLDSELSGCVPLSNAPGPTPTTCTTLAPGARGSVHHPLNKVGAVTELVHLRAADGTHEIKATATVSAFDDSGCAISPGRSAEHGWLVLGGLVGLWWRARRRR